MTSKPSKLSLSLIIVMPITAIFLLTGIAIHLATKMSIPTFISSLNAETITVQELRKLQQNNLNSVLLIDVRTPEEYQEKHIENSVLIPLTDIELGFGVKQISNLISQEKKTVTIVLYCTSGVRSFKAYKILQENGIKTVSLKGGINAWQKNYQIIILPVYC